MKKVLLFIAVFLAFILIYVLQTNFFTWFTIAGVKPNLVVMLVLFIGLFIGSIYGLTFGVIFGLLIDIFISKKIGISAIMLGTIGILGGIINAMIFSYTWEMVSFITKLIIEIIYNSILTIILYPTIQKAGFAAQDMFKENKILTRYY